MDYYKYYILSAADDFYMSDAIRRELERTGAPCYFNLRDSKKEEKMPDNYDKIGSQTSIIAVVNNEFISNGKLTSPVSFYSKKVTDGEVYILLNGSIREYPEKWNSFCVINATKGLNNDIISVVKGEKKARSVNPANFISSGKQSDLHHSAEGDDNIFYRPNVLEAYDIIESKEEMSSHLQRALRYLAGDGVPKDGDRAYSLVKKAIAENPEDAITQYYWGLCNQLGFGDGNVDEAKKAYQKAIELGSVPSFVRFGLICLAEKDYEEAKTLFTKAMEKNDPMGAFGLGLVNESEEKYDEAIECYSEAAELGNVFAQNALGCLYGEGKGVKQDYNKSFEWFQLAIGNGLVEAFVNNGLILYNSNDPKTKEMGEMCFQKAAEQGSQVAQQILEEIEEEKKSSKPRQSRRNDDNDNDDGNDGNGGESSWGVFLDALDLPGLFGQAKSTLWDR